MIRTGNIALQGCGRGIGAGKCAAHICGVMKRPSKCAPHICEVNFHPGSALRIYARSIFSRVMRSAYMRGQFSARKCAPHICVVKLPGRNKNPMTNNKHRERIGEKRTMEL